MKIIVVGAMGLIGAKAVEILCKNGHEVIAASRRTGVNTVTGEGLKAALQGADVVLDVSNGPSWEDKAVMEFFETSTKNILAAEAESGVKHHVALGVVGTDRLQDSGYFRAKLVQEKLIKASRTPYTIVHATQFFEFVGGIADNATVGTKIHLSTAMMQPIAAADVSAAVAATCSEAPANGTVEIAGPEKLRQNDLVEKYLKATNDKREIVAAPDALYFGLKLNDQSLVPTTKAKLGPTTFDQWLKQTQLAPAK
jgi:uncharacterized protein YbjT (DUF2867 family)